MSTVAQIMDALATQIDTVLSAQIDELQIDSRLVPNPTPPSIDIYPGDPFVESLGFGPGNKELYFTVRARVLTADNEAGQDLLLELMDPTAATSMEQAIMGERTLGGTATVHSVEGPTNYGLYPSGGDTLLGCTWRVRVIPDRSLPPAPNFTRRNDPEHSLAVEQPARAVRLRRTNRDVRAPAA